MLGSRSAFILVLVVVAGLSVAPAYVSSQGYSTVTTQLTSTQTTAVAIGTQYATSTGTEYSYVPANFTIQPYTTYNYGSGYGFGSSFGSCTNSTLTAEFNATQGETLHFQWAASNPLVLDFYITAPQEVSGQSWCVQTEKSSAAPHTWLYGGSIITGAVDWVAPSTSRYVAILINNGDAVVSGAFSIQTTHLSLISSTNYVTETTTELIDTFQIVTAASVLSSASAGSSFVPSGMPSPFILIGVVVALAFGGFAYFRRRHSSLEGSKSGSEEAKHVRHSTAKNEPPAAPPSPALAPTATVITQPNIEKPIVTIQRNDLISTGYGELDEMLSGGLPDRYAVLFASPSYDERDLLLGKIIDSNFSNNNPSFYVSSDARKMEDLLSRYPDNFFAFCSQADKIAAMQPHLFNVGDIRNLSDFNITLTTSLKKISVAPGARKIMIIDILQDILLHHKLPITRRWLFEFLTKRKADGFTILATFNPFIAAREEVQIIIDSFDGVIEIYERDLKERSRRFLAIKKMYGLRYSDGELMLDKNKLY